MDTVRKLLAWVVLAYLVVISLTGCATVPPPKVLVVPQERVQIQRPELPIQKLTETASAAQVFQAYQESLLLCIGYAKQLEAIHNNNP